MLRLLLVLWKQAVLEISHLDELSDAHLAADVLYHPSDRHFLDGEEAVDVRRRDDHLEDAGVVFLHNEKIFSPVVNQHSNLNL